MDNSYDIAISLCKEDVDFAKRIVNQLNPSLKVFFYADRQEELIAKCAPEEFSNIFKLKSKIVVIISRKEWGNSYYTELERNAIISRLPQEGYGFLFVIPIIAGEIPTWYPPTHIYIDPTRFSIEQIAQFLEYKFVELGGILKQVTLEDRYEHFLRKKAEKQAIIRLQTTPEAIASGQLELMAVRNIFNEKANYLAQSLFDQLGTQPFSDNTFTANCSLGNYILECAITNTDNVRIVTTQNFEIFFQISRLYDVDVKKPIATSEKLRYYFTNHQTGWAARYLYEQASSEELPVLFIGKERNERYELKDPKTTRDLVDFWFQLLFEHSTKNISRYTQT